MKLSVVIPAYNTARYIAEALGSVLAQIDAETEVIVVDDGSADETAAIAERFGPPVRVIRAAHGGIGATINRGMSEAKGERIATIDADDRWLPGKTALQLAALDGDTSLDAVFGHVRQFLSPDVTEPARFAFAAGPMPGLIRGTMIVRRQAWERVGPLETGLAAGEFVGWYARAVDAGLRTRMLPDVVYERRIHANNPATAGTHDDYLRVVKATMDRRRARLGQIAAGESTTE
jgi:glycosyltransferase involved in cell wall biosynthesis